MKYTEFKEEAEKRVSAILKLNGVFFAFSDKQYYEAADKNIKYTSAGSGCFLPVENVNQHKKSWAKFQEWKKEAIKEVDPVEVIEYELNNYECFYIGSIEDALPTLLGYGFTREQVEKVYQDKFKNHQED